MSWKKVCQLTEIPSKGARIVKTEKTDIAVFRTSTDDVFAVHDKCPHRGGPLSQGIVYGNSVACPLHGWVIHLDSGEAKAPDVGCVKKFATKVEDGVVYLQVGA